MAPTNRNSLQNASKRIKTMISSPAHFIRKRFRRSGSAPKVDRIQSPAGRGNFGCTHTPVGIGKYTDRSEARTICDLFIEHAAVYSQAAEQFLHELNEQFSTIVEMWRIALEAMKCGSGMSREAHRALREFHSKAVSDLNQMVNDAQRNIWKRPDETPSCRYHHDLDGVYIQVCHCDDHIQGLLDFLEKYLTDCKGPTEYYGIKCRFDLRMKLLELDDTYNEVMTSLRYIHSRFGRQLKDNFYNLQNTALAVEEFLVDVRMEDLAEKSTMSSILIFQLES